MSDRKKAGQIPYLKREVEVLLALRGTLNVANLHGVYEDATHVHLVMELCAGGELLARTAAPSGKPGSGAPRAAAHNRSGAAAAPSRYHYSERTAASFLRAVLRTVAQCHAKRIIHRDIKPENVGAGLAGGRVGWCGMKRRRARWSKQQAGEGVEQVLA